MHTHLFAVVLLGFVLVLFTGCSAAPYVPPAPPLVTGQTLALSTQDVPTVIADAPDSAPSMKVYLPPEGVKASGAVVIVFPGGGYTHLADHEGGPVAEWLAKNGITAFVLKYHLGPKFHYPVELEDAQAAIQTVRFCAPAWHLDPQRIGVMGFSAGGHLASSTATHPMPVATRPVPYSGPPRPDSVSPRPDLQVLVYPVITMDGPNTHRGSRTSLLGNNPDPSLLELLSNQKQITATTPPAFVVHSTQDPVVPVSNSDDYVAALKAHGVPYEFVRGPYGGHGFGMKDFWTEPCMVWLHKQGF